MSRESRLSSTLERVMGLEPTISCLGSKRSTTELHPLSVKNYTRDRYVEQYKPPSFVGFFGIGKRSKYSGHIGCADNSLRLVCVSRDKPIGFVARHKVHTNIFLDSFLVYIFSTVRVVTTISYGKFNFHLNRSWVVNPSIP